MSLTIVTYCCTTMVESMSAREGSSSKLAEICKPLYTRESTLVYRASSSRGWPFLAPLCNGVHKSIRLLLSFLASSGDVSRDVFTGLRNAELIRDYRMHLWTARLPICPKQRRILCAFRLQLQHILAHHELYFYGHYLNVLCICMSVYSKITLVHYGVVIKIAAELSFYSPRRLTHGSLRQ